VAVTGPIIEAYISVFDVLIVAALALYFMKKRMTWRYVAMIVPALATLLLYSLVYVESRYLGGSVVLLFLCFAASIQFNRNAMRGVSAIAAALAVYYGASSLNETRIAAVDMVRLLRHGWPHSQMETAVDLRKLGVAEGSRVAAIGYAFSGYWARLARVQIAMQVPDGRAYASATDSAKANVLDAFRKSGAVAVVSVGAPSPRQGEEWRRIGPAGYWVMLLSPQSHSP